MTLLEIFFYELLMSIAHSIFWVIIIAALAVGILVVLNFDYPEKPKKSEYGENF
jgi:hypothetical protein